MDKMLEVLASLMKEKGIPKTWAILLLSFFSVITLVMLYLSYVGKESSLISNIGTSSFYSLCLTSFLLILGFAKKEKESDMNFERQLTIVTSIISAEAIDRLKFKLNKAFESTDIDEEANLLPKDKGEVRSFFMKKYGDNNEKNFEGAWIVFFPKYWSAFYWKDVEGKGSYFKLGNTEDDVISNMSKIKTAKFIEIKDFNDIDFSGPYSDLHLK